MKLGTVQRWVRDINLNTSLPDPQKVRALDLVLRCTDEFKEYGIEEDEVGRGEIIKREDIEMTPLQSPHVNQEFIHFGTADYKTISFEKANERVPKNFFDLSI